MISSTVSARRFSLRVVEVDPQTDSRWEAFVARHPDALVYHHPAWLKTLRREYDRPAVGLGCLDGDGRLCGVLSLVSTRGLPFGAGGPLAGRRLSSLPRTPISGPLALDNDATAALVRAAVERVRAAGAAQLQLKVASPELDGMAEGLGRIPWRLSYVLDLTGNPEALRFGDGRHHRRNTWAVNKARRLGVQVRQAETETDLRDWYPLYLDTMRTLAVPPRSYRFFQTAWDTLRTLGLMRLLLAEQWQGNRPRLLAGSVFLGFGHTIFHAFTGWRRSDHSLRANDLIHWQAIRDASREGFRFYDFGEVAGGQGSLAAFKSKWGGEPVPLYRYQYPAPVRIQTGARPSGTLWRVGSAAWRRLPLAATAALGDRLYSYL